MNIKLIIINAFMITIINGDYYHFDTLLLLIIITQFFIWYNYTNIVNLKVI